MLLFKNFYDFNYDIWEFSFENVGLYLTEGGGVNCFRLRSNLGLLRLSYQPTLLSRSLG